MPADRRNAEHATSFDRAADVYERSRPAYPDESVDWLVASSPSDVLDLGAGTGKLTRALADRVRVVHAVDPSPNMLAQLSAARPDVHTAVGTAEDIPLPDDSVDAVVGAQMWHWVDPDRAVPEVRRVLRPGGVFGLIWNVRDESVAWVAELTRIIQQSAAEQFIHDGAPIPTELGDVESLVVAWSRPFDRQGLLDLVASRSYIITATDDVRSRILAEVSDLLDTHPALADEASWHLPYRTEAFRVTVD